MGRFFSVAIRLVISILEHAASQRRAGGSTSMKNALAVIATVGLASAFPMQAQAATDLFLTWPGIIGPSTVQRHAGDIELTSYTQTASNTFSQSSYGGG